MPRLLVDPSLRAAVIPPLVLSSPLNTNEMVAVAILAMHGEVSFPSLKRIAEFMHCSYDTASRTVATLKSKGWLEISSRQAENGQRTSNLYRLCVPADAPLHVEGVPRNLRDTTPATCAPLNTDSESLNSGTGVPARMAHLQARESSPVQRVLKDYESAARELLGRKPVLFYARDGRLIKRMLESFPEQKITAMGKRFLDECRTSGRPFTIPAFFAACERLAQSNRSVAR